MGINTRQRDTKLPEVDPRTGYGTYNGTIRHQTRDVVIKHNTIGIKHGVGPFHEAGRLFDGISGAGGCVHMDHGLKLYML